MSRPYSRLVVATNNDAKMREIRELMQNHFDEILSIRQIGLQIEVEEDGDTFADNAVKKAQTICALTNSMVLADDSGLCVDALGGAPGVHSARYAGQHGDDAANNALLLDNMQGIAWEQRTARFVSVVALARPSQSTITAAGEVEGHILEQAQGDQGFGYDPLFYATELGVSFGQASSQQKNSISHRARALQALRVALCAEEAQ